MTHDFQKTHESMMNELRNCEKYITEHFEQFLKIAEMFNKIREERLYEADGYRNFEEYVAKKWRYQKAYGYQIANLGRTRTLLRAELARERGVEESAIAENELPTKEGQARSLNKFREDPAKMREVWEEAKATSGNDQPTQLEVEATIKNLSLSEPNTKSKPLTAEMRIYKKLLEVCGQPKAELSNEYMHWLFAEDTDTPWLPIEEPKMSDDKQKIIRRSLPLLRPVKND